MFILCIIFIVLSGCSIKNNSNNLSVSEEYNKKYEKLNIVVDENKPIELFCVDSIGNRREIGDSWRDRLFFYNRNIEVICECKKVDKTDIVPRDYYNGKNDCRAIDNYKRYMTKDQIYNAIFLSTGYTSKMSSGQYFIETYGGTIENPAINGIEFINTNTQKHITLKLKDIDKINEETSPISGCNFISDLKVGSDNFYTYLKCGVSAMGENVISYLKVNFNGKDMDFIECRVNTDAWCYVDSSKMIYDSENSSWVKDSSFKLTKEICDSIVTNTKDLDKEHLLDKFLYNKNPEKLMKWSKCIF